MQIFVKVPSGKTHTLDVKSSVSIAYVKAKIQELEGIPMREQRLTYNDKDLKDMRTLDESDVMNEATLHLMLRIVGGAGKKDTVVKKSKQVDAKKVANAARNYDALNDVVAPEGVRELARHISENPPWAETALKTLSFDKTKRMLQGLEALPMLNAERLVSIASVFMVEGYEATQAARDLHDATLQILKSAFMLSFHKWGEGPTTFYALAKERFAEAEKEEIRREAVLATVRKYGISVELATDAVMQDTPTYTC